MKIQRKTHYVDHSPGPVNDTLTRRILMLLHLKCKICFFIPLMLLQSTIPVFFFTSFVCFGRTENTQLPTNDDVELCAGIIFSGSYDKKNRFSISRFSKARASTHMRCDSCVSQRCQRISCFFFARSMQCEKTNS